MIPQRCHSVLSNTLWKRQAAAFVLSMLKVNAAAWRSRRLHSVYTALLAFAQRAPRRSAIFLNAVRTPLWCDRGFSNQYLHLVNKSHQNYKHPSIKSKLVK